MKERSQRFLEEIQQRVFVCDGAMGTVLYTKNVPASRCFEELNLSMPSLIKEVHEAYGKAGAEVLETNTFGANSFRLAPYGLDKAVREINRAGARLARECAGETVLVAGAAGPLGVRVEPVGPCTLAQARDAFRDQIQALAEGGADLILLETFYDWNEIHEAMAAAREVCDLPLIAQVTIDDEGNMLSGTSPEHFTPKLVEWGADLIGINCSVGPQATLDAIQRLAALTHHPLSAQPNAGLPVNIGGRNMYLCSPEYMAGYATRFIRSGVKLLGGCCGTTPEHIRAIRDAVGTVQPPRPRIAVASPPEPVQRLQPVPLRERSELARKLADDEFVVLAEVAPSRGWDTAKEIEGARYLAENGVDAIHVPDGQRGGARMSAQAMAYLLQDRAGLETVLQYSCRDRNILSIQSDLLGAYALGLRNLILLTGDPPRRGNYPDATAVFDVDAVGLTRIVSNLNLGLDIGGNFIGMQTGFLIAVLANPGAADLEQEMERVRAKARAGAECVVTQAVFDEQRLERFCEGVRPLRLPVLAGILPLTSFRNAEFLANEMQVSVPETILDRMRAADSGERARAEGIRIAQETAVQLRPLVQGIQVSAPLGRYGTVAEVIRVLREESGKPAAASPEASPTAGSA